MQCENHAQFVDVALGYGWELFEYGTDSTCIVGGDAPHLALIWLKPCAWDQDQKIPVGCLCCTDLDEELIKWNEELFSIVESRRLRGAKMALPDDYSLDENASRMSETPVSFLRPYRAR